MPFPASSALICIDSQLGRSNVSKTGILDHILAENPIFSRGSFPLTMILSKLKELAKVWT